MKKYLLLLSILLLSCEKEAPETTASVMVNVFYKYSNSDETKIASPTLVMLFKENYTEFDFEESVNSMYSSQEMTLKNGTTATPKYISSSFSGINTFEEVEKGNYTVIAYYKPDGYSWAFSYYYAYKDIVVDDLQVHKIIFTWSDDAGKFVSK